jgi:cytochrome c peroxidase
MDPEKLPPMKLFNRLLAATAVLGLSAHFAQALAQSAPPPPPAPPGNPITVNKALLGKVLFWDEQLSSTGTMACATCHIPTAGGSDPRSVANPDAVHPGPDGLFGSADDIVASPGVPSNLGDGTYSLSDMFGFKPQVTSRKAPTMINAVYSPNVQFWDGRSQGTFTDPISGVVVLANGAALESQVAGPPVSEVEMGHIGADWAGVVARLELATPMDLAENLPVPMANFVTGRSYPQLFSDAFGTAQVTAARICMAIATYERTLVGATAPFDDFLGNGQLPPQNPGALTAQERQGEMLFRGQGRCLTCHNGPVMSDNNFHYTGVRPRNEDLGRFDVTGVNADRGRMKTPSLRNVELRAPYFHNGRFATLEDVVDFYNRGGDFDAPNKAANVQPLGLNGGERAALVAFLRRPLTDVRVRDGLPPFDGPTLYSESSHVPTMYGAGTPGTGGFIPRVYAIEPPRIGGESMTVAIDNALGGRMAIFAHTTAQDLVGTPITGTTFHVGLTGTLALRRIPMLDGVGAGQGHGSVTVAVPSDPMTAGTSRFGQWFVLDNGSGARFAASEAVRFDWY